VEGDEVKIKSPDDGQMLSQSIVLFVILKLRKERLIFTVY
jgi:hypothetical protein